MIVKKVSSKQDVRAFLDLPVKIYKNYPNWVRPLDKDIEAVFDENLNRAFKNGICERWLLLSPKKEVIGRVATFVNKKYEQEQPTGGIGFFEDRKSTRLNSSHVAISYAVFCLKKKKK